VILAILLGLALFFLAKSLIGSSPTVQVPQVTGLNVQAAVLKLEDAHLKPKVKFKASAKPKNQVLKQDPAAGDQAAKDSVVTLTVSGGQQQVAVPDLTGLSLADATTTLTQHQLQLGSESSASPSDTVAKNHIISTRPTPGTQVDVNTAVDYVLSTGPS